MGIETQGTTQCECLWFSFCLNHPGPDTKEAVMLI